VKKKKKTYLNHAHLQDVGGVDWRELLIEPVIRFGLCPAVIVIKVGTRGTKGRKTERSQVKGRGKR